MTTSIKSLIRRFHGYGYERAGSVAAFFEDPRQAQACAQEIQLVSPGPVEVCGCQVTFEASPLHARQRQID